MMKKKYWAGLGLALSFLSGLFAAEQATGPVSLASNSFSIPSTPPDTVITSDSLAMASGAVTLIGNVRAINGDKILTSGKATLWKSPDRLLASLTPRLYQKEMTGDKAIPEKMVTRESTLDALNILWDQTQNRISASPAVSVKMDERSWDLATHSWIIISADSFEGFRDTNKLNFQGNVRIKDKAHFGQGNRLDYDKAANNAVLSGNARVEKEEWSLKERRMIKRILTGERIIYDLASKSAQSE
ncbi:MAG: hypothetical protein WA705_23985 [Candidatus Ozemobacteraceae bacterium]